MTTQARNAIINDSALAQAILTEGSRLGIQNASAQPQRDMKINADGRLVLDFCRLVHYNEPLFDSTYAWLLNDPRTTVTENFLNLATTYDRGEYIVKLEVTVPLLNEDIQLLRALGKIVTEQYSYTTLVC